MLLISFSCLIALAKTSSTMLNESDKSKHSFLVSDLRGKALSLSPISMLDVGFSYMAFIMLPFIPSLLHLYILKRC